MAADVSAPLPQLDLAPLSVLRVDTGDASRKITSLVIHGYQLIDVAAAPPGEAVAPLFVPVPVDG